MALARVYLDHNATSPLRPAAAAAERAAQESGAANPSSMHTEGRLARRIVENAREQVAALVGARPRDVVFTSSGSEAVAAALRGLCDRTPGARARIVVSAIEHSCVLETARSLARDRFELVVVGCEPSGVVDPSTFERAIDPGVAVAALQAANNETGALQPIDRIGRACARAGVPLLVDAVQAAGKIAIDPVAWGADLVAVSGHKIGAPHGTGALYVRDGLALDPLIAGGAQERRRRAGTEAVAALAGFGVAAEIAETEREGEVARLRVLRERLERDLADRHPGLVLHAGTASRLPNTTCFSIPGIEGETLVIALDLEGFAVSSGSACSSGAVEPSHVLLAMGRSDSEARSAVRVSLGWSTTDEEVDRFLVALSRVVEGIVRGR